MTSQLDICNMALAEIGSRSKITALNDGSTEANYCNLYYTSVRDQILRAARWNCVGRADNLVLWKALPGTPENPTGVTGGWTPAYPTPPWLYSYLAPIDTLFVYARSVIAQPNISTPSIPIFSSQSSFPMSGAWRVPFVISVDPWDTNGTIPLAQPKKIILTNAQTPIFEWTCAFDESLWDDSLIMVTVLGLSARLAIALTSNIQLAQIKMQSANGMIEAARANDGNEGLTVLDHMPDWLTIRGAGSSFSSGFDFYYPYGPLFSFA